MCKTVTLPLQILQEVTLVAHCVQEVGVQISA